MACNCKDNSNRVSASDFRAAVPNAPTARRRPAEESDGFVTVYTASGKSIRVPK